MPASHNNILLFAFIFFLKGRATAYRSVYSMFYKLRGAEKKTTDRNKVRLLKKDAGAINKYFSGMIAAAKTGIQKKQRKEPANPYPVYCTISYQDEKHRLNARGFVINCNKIHRHAFPYDRLKPRNIFKIISSGSIIVLPTLMAWHYNRYRVFS